MGCIKAYIHIPYIHKYYGMNNENKKQKQYHLTRCVHTSRIITHPIHTYHTHNIPRNPNTLQYKEHNSSYFYEINNIFMKLKTKNVIIIYYNYDDDADDDDDYVNLFYDNTFIRLLVMYCKYCF